MHVYSNNSSTQDQLMSCHHIISTTIHLSTVSQATKLSFCDVHIECCYQVFGISLFARGAPP